MTAGRLATALAGVLLLGACGGGPATPVAGPSGTTSAPLASATAGLPAPAPSAARSAPAADPAQVQAATALVGDVAAVAPVTGDTLGPVLQRMPETLSGASVTRTPSSTSYALPSGTATLEATEAGDVYGAAAATDRSALVDRLVADQGVTVYATCTQGGAACVVGGLPDGTALALWAPEGSDLLLAAVAPTLDDLTRLLDAVEVAAR